MKKALAILGILLVILAAGCAKDATVKNRVEGEYRAYCEMSDGTWRCNGRTYQYRLELRGTMPNAAANSTFVYLSNLEDISFEQAWKAAGFSSNSEDYFPPEEAVLVELH